MCVWRLFIFSIFLLVEASNHSSQLEDFALDDASKKTPWAMLKCNLLRNKVKEGNGVQSGGCLDIIYVALNACNIVETLIFKAVENIFSSFNVMI